MRDIFKAFETFFLKGLDFSGRATRLEYWAVMPVVWLIIIALFVGDAQEFWDFLLRRQVPPLNPFYYDSIVVFLLTFIPRLALTVRRLHDVGKSGMWAKLPFVAATSGFILLIGLSAAAVSIGAGRGSGSMIEPLMAIVMSGAIGGFWSGLFTFASVLNNIGWDPILSGITNLGNQGNAAQGIATFSESTSGMPGVGPLIMLRMIIMVGTPLISVTLHFYFMTKPTFRDDNRYGSFSSVSVPLQPKKPEKELLQGYACLFDRTDEEKAIMQANRAEEVKSLYQTRVLGKREA